MEASDQKQEQQAKQRGNRGNSNTSEEARVEVRGNKSRGNSEGVEKHEGGRQRAETARESKS